MMAVKRVLNALYSPKWLIATNTTTGALFLGAGDLIEQQLIERRLLLRAQHFDANRTLGMTFTGIYFGFCGHFWYKFLDKRFPSSARKHLLKKLSCEAAIGPPFGASVFFIVGQWEGKPVRQSLRELRANLALLCLADWCFFIPLQTLNFVFLSPKFRILFVSVISIFYDTFLSYILHTTTDGDTTQP